MKNIGLLGGMSWESTLEYYRALNKGVQEALGGLHSARIVMHSVDFDPIEAMMQRGEWDAIARVLGNAAEGLEKAGADFFLICTNTMHKLAADIESRVDIPLLHIADATAEVLQTHGITRVGLLGTSFTMEHDFYRERLLEYDVYVVIPEVEDRKIVNNVIFTELCRGKVNADSRREYIRIMKALTERRAEAILFGCTEIGILVDQKDVDIQLFDTTPIHAASAVRMALAE